MSAFDNSKTLFYRHSYCYDARYFFALSDVYDCIWYNE